MQRLLAGMAKALAEQGYARATVENVIENAGVSRKTFYEYFDDKESCLLVAYGVASDQLWRATTKAAAEFDDWPARVHAAVAAALEFIAADPYRARLFTLEARAAGNAMADRQHADFERAAGQLRHGREGHPEAEGLPEATEMTLIDNVVAITGAHVISGATELLLPLESQLTEYLLTPYLGVERARVVATEPQAPSAATRRISSAAAWGPM